jgi:hypothetical protein
VVLLLLAFIIIIVFVAHRGTTLDVLSALSSSSGTSLPAWIIAYALTAKCFLVAGIAELRGMFVVEPFQSHGGSIPNKASVMHGSNFALEFDRMTAAGIRNALPVWTAELFGVFGDAFTPEEGIIQRHEDGPVAIVVRFLLLIALLFWLQVLMEPPLVTLIFQQLYCGGVIAYHAWLRAWQIVALRSSRAAVAAASGTELRSISTASPESQFLLDETLAPALVCFAVLLAQIATTFLLLLRYHRYELGFSRVAKVRAQMLMLPSATRSAGQAAFGSETLALRSTGPHYASALHAADGDADADARRALEIRRLREGRYDRALLDLLHGDGRGSRGQALRASSESGLSDSALQGDERGRVASQLGRERLENPESARTAPLSALGGGVGNGTVPQALALRMVAEELARHSQESEADFAFDLRGIDLQIAGLESLLPSIIDAVVPNSAGTVPYTGLREN